MARLADTLWIVPAIYVVLALWLSVYLTGLDESDPLALSLSIDASSASAALSALGSGMIAFTGFVTSIVLLVVQFGTSEFSPRLVRWLRRDRTLKYALSTFIATFLFAIVSTAQVGRGEASFVPARTLVAALGFTLLSIAMLLLLIDRTSNGLRVANVLQRLDAAARRVFDTTYPGSASDAAAALETARSLEGEPALQTIVNPGVGAVLVTIDRTGLVRLAQHAGAVVELAHAVGDHVPTGGALVKVYGPTPLSERRVLRAMVLGDERTLDNDPAFGLRLMVDVAIKALSPAVNDPTTAKQSLDRIEDLLRYAASKHLSVGTVRDAAGAIRLMYPTPTWEDLVELALTEIRTFGAGQFQIVRRMRALFDALLTDLSDRRHPALLAQRALLDDAVAAALPASQREAALVADRQGLGMSRRPVVDSTGAP